MRRNRVRAARRALAAAALAMPLAAAGDAPTLTLSAGIHLIHAEVASTFDTRALGLMHRKSLAANHGMLFVFPEVARHCMWMRNTLVPLSVAFIDEQSVVLNIADMQPRTEDSHCASAPARYALEMSAGWFAAKGIGPGTKITGLQQAPPPR